MTKWCVPASTRLCTCGGCLLRVCHVPFPPEQVVQKRVRGYIFEGTHRMAAMQMWLHRMWDRHDEIRNPAAAELDVIVTRNIPSFLAAWWGRLCNWGKIGGDKQQVRSDGLVDLISWVGRIITCYPGRPSIALSKQQQVQQLTECIGQSKGRHYDSADPMHIRPATLKRCVTAVRCLQSTDTLNFLNQLPLPAIRQALEWGTGSTEHRRKYDTAYGTAGWISQGILYI